MRAAPSILTPARQWTATVVGLTGGVVGRMAAMSLLGLVAATALGRAAGRRLAAARRRARAVTTTARKIVVPTGTGNMTEGTVAKSGGTAVAAVAAVEETTVWMHRGLPTMTAAMEAAGQGAGAAQLCGLGTNEALYLAAVIERREAVSPFCLCPYLLPA